MDSSTVPPREAAPFPPLPTRSPAPGGLRSACSGDSPAQSHTPLLRDLTWVRWFGLEHHQPTSLSLARQRQAIRYRPASEGHQRLPRTLNHPASELGPTGLGQRDRDSLHTCPAPRHPTALPQGQDGPHSCKHLLTYTQRGQDPGSPGTLGIPKHWGQADGAPALPAQWHDNLA